MSLSDRIVVMRQGRIEQVAPPEAVYRHPESMFVADFIGQANFIDVEDTSMIVGGSESVARVQVFGKTVDVPAHRSVSGGSPAVLLVRPESVSVRSAQTGSVIGGAIGRVLSSVFYGAGIEYEIEAESGNITAVVHDPLPGDILETGAMVEISIEAERAWLLPSEPAS